MEIESFGFTLLTAVLGMALVVLFLVFLSVVMYGIKRLSGEGTGAESVYSGADTEAEKTAESASTALGPSPEQGAKFPGWVAAAAAAYLADEDRAHERRVSAWPWVGSRLLGTARGPIAFAEGGRTRYGQE